MAKERINFKISQFLLDWIRTNPGILSIDRGDDYCVVEHNFTAGQLSTFKQQVAARLSETI